LIFLKDSFRFIDLFSGIGGFHLGLNPLGGKCVLACDIDPIANQTYLNNFGMAPLGDIKDIESQDIPDFDLLCAGFPCQSFSYIGPKGGLKDPRGALIFHVFRILKDKIPRAFILENVKGLITINNGKIFEYIMKKLQEINYTIYWKVLKASDYGLPQIRQRLFIVGIHKNCNYSFEFPKKRKLDFTLSDVMNGKTDRECAFTIRIGGRHSGINNRFNWDCYLVNGKPRYITPEECLILQGFPVNFKLYGNLDQKYRQVGNSVPTNIVNSIGSNMAQKDKFLC